MRKTLTVLFVWFCSHTARAQQQGIPLALSFFNNGTALPGTGYAGVFSKKVHPGITVGTRHLYHQKPGHELFQTLKLGYFYHQFSQHALQLYTELGYRYLFSDRISAEGLLGAGYLHAFSDVQQFRFDNGHYVKKANWGRPQLMGTASIGLGYRFAIHTSYPFRLFIKYQFWLQMPFVNKYVPVLPNTALHFGISYLLPHRSKK
jgi:hypothetical protein